MKKVIEQKDGSRIEIEFGESRIRLLELSPFDDFGGLVSIGKSKSREVALAICPELGLELKELEFKANGFRLQNEFFTKIRSELLPTEKDLTLPWYEMLYECIKNRRLKP